MACPEYQSLTEDLATARTGQRKAMSDYAEAQRQATAAGWNETLTDAKSALDHAEQEVKTTTQALKEHKETCEACRAKR